MDIIRGQRDIEQNRLMLLGLLEQAQIEGKTKAQVERNRLKGRRGKSVFVAL